jgi:hypothetical protein
MQRNILPLLLLALACRSTQPTKTTTSQPAQPNTTQTAAKPTEQNVAQRKSSFVIFLDSTGPEPRATELLRELLKSAGNTVQTKDEALSAWEKDIEAKLAAGQLDAAKNAAFTPAAEWYAQGEFEQEGDTLWLFIAMLHIETDIIALDLEKRTTIKGSLDAAKDELIRAAAIDMIQKVHELPPARGKMAQLFISKEKGSLSPDDTAPICGELKQLRQELLDCTLSEALEGGLLLTLQVDGDADNFLFSLDQSKLFGHKAMLTKKTKGMGYLLLRN